MPKQRCQNISSNNNAISEDKSSVGVKFNDKIFPDFKIVTLGCMGCGKTSLVQRFMKRRTPNTGEICPTIGGAFNRFSFVPEGGDHAGEAAMGIWDTAGCERYLAVSRMYYRDAFAAVLCYDVTDAFSLERVRFWLKELRRFESQCRIYIVGCKSDLPRSVQPEDIKPLIEEFGAKFYETSSKTGSQVDDVFLNIYREYKKEIQLKNRGSVVDLEDDEENITKKASAKYCICS